MKMKKLLTEKMCKIVNKVGAKNFSPLHTICIFFTDVLKFLMQNFSMLTHQNFRWIFADHDEVVCRD